MPDNENETQVYAHPGAGESTGGAVEEPAVPETPSSGSGDEADLSTVDNGD